MSIIQVERERLASLMRWLVDEGHLTPVGVRQINNVLDDEVEKHTTNWPKFAANMLELSKAEPGETVLDAEGKCILCGRLPKGEHGTDGAGVRCPGEPRDCLMVGLIEDMREHARPAARPKPTPKPPTPNESR